jgi:4-hydroxy-tetrahydrodipicolinate synthase
MDLSGVWVPVVTPFDVDDNVDQASLRSLIHRLADAGARGVVALGTTGEPAVLSDVERRVVVDICEEECAARGMPLLVGIGTNSTSAVVASARALEARRVAGALVVSPYYSRPSLAGVVEHYRVVAGESPVPIVAYNVPYRTGRGLDADALVEIARVPNVIGLKQSVGMIDADTLDVLRRSPDTFQLLAGDDAFIGPTVLMGGVGAIAAAAHVCTPLFVEMVEAARRHDVPTTRSISEVLLPMVTAGFAEPSPAVWKGALHRMGAITTPHVRLPMTAASRQAIDRLMHEIEQTGALSSQRATVAPVATVAP